MYIHMKTFRWHMWSTSTSRWILQTIFIELAELAGWEVARLVSQVSQVLLSFICGTISGRSGHQLCRQPGRGQSCAEFGDSRQEEHWNPTGGLQMLYRGNYLKSESIFRWTATSSGSSSSEERGGREHRGWVNKVFHILKSVLTFFLPSNFDSKVCKTGILAVNTAPTNLNASKWGHWIMSQCSLDVFDH